MDPETKLACSRCSTPSNESIIFTPQSSPLASPSQTALKSVPSHSGGSATAASYTALAETASALIDIVPKLSIAPSSNVEIPNFPYPDRTKQCGHLAQPDYILYQKYGSETSIGSAGYNTIAAALSFHVPQSQQPQLAVTNTRAPRNVNEYISDLRNLANDAEQYAMEYPQQNGYLDIMTIINQEINNIKADVGLGTAGNLDAFCGMRKDYAQQLSIQKAATTHYRNDGCDVHIIPGPKVYPYKKYCGNDEPAPFGSVPCADPFSSSDWPHAKLKDITLTSSTRKYNTLGQSFDGSDSNQVTDQVSILECMDEDFSLNEELAEQKDLGTFDSDITDVLHNLRGLENEAQRLIKQHPNVQQLLNHILEDITAIIDATVAEKWCQKEIASETVQGGDFRNLDFQEYGGQRMEIALEEKVARHFKQEDANKFRCCVSECTKLFIEERFWRKHVDNMHQDWLAALRQELKFMDVYAPKPEEITTSGSDFDVDSVLQRGLIVQDLLDKQQHFQARLQAAVELSTILPRTGSLQKSKRISTSSYPRHEVWVAAGDEEEMNVPHTEFGHDSIFSAGSEDSVSFDGKADEDISARATTGDEIVNKETVEMIDKCFDDDELSLALFANLTPDERVQYVSTVDNILRDSNLQIISTRAVREAMSTKLGKDFSSQKAATNHLILERFARISATTALTSEDDAISKDAELAHRCFSSSGEFAEYEPGFDRVAPATETDPIDQTRSLKHDIPKGQSPQLQSPTEYTDEKQMEELNALGEMPTEQSTSVASRNTIFEEKALMLSQILQLQSEIEGHEKRAIEMQREMEAKLTASYLVAEEEQNRLVLAHNNATRASQARLVEADHAFATMYIEKLDLEKTIEELRTQFQKHDDSLVHGFESLIETIQSEHAEEVVKLKARIRKLNTRKFETDLSAERELNEDLEEE